MTRSDVTFAARAHQKFFRQGFFARLGTRFLSEYYATFLDSTHACAFIAESEGRPVGYLAARLNPAAHHEAVMARHRWRLARVGVASLLLRPLLMLRFLGTRAPRYLQRLTAARGRSSPPASTGTAEAVLDYLAVLPSHRGRGVGAELLSAFTGHATGYGCTRARLVTDNELAISFYTGLAWQADGARTIKDGRVLIHLVRTLGKPDQTNRHPGEADDLTPP